jgi:hypothetical protein
MASDGCSTIVDKVIEDQRHHLGHCGYKVIRPPGEVKGFRNADGWFGRLVRKALGSHLGDYTPDAVQPATPLAAIIQVLLHEFSLRLRKQPADKI